MRTSLNQGTMSRDTPHSTAIPRGSVSQQIANLVLLKLKSIQENNVYFGNQGKLGYCMVRRQQKTSNHFIPGTNAWASYHRHALKVMAL
jgi:hypothetical protein